jgi:hypothetical protein
VQPLQRHRRSICFFTLLAAASLAKAQQSGAPSASYRARVMGVYDVLTGLPIEGAEIVDLKTGTLAITTKTGTISLAFLPDGGSTVRVRKMGYIAITRFMAISPDDTVPITLMLEQTPTALATVTTKDTTSGTWNAGLRGFETRSKSGAGHFITQAELRRSDNRQMLDLLGGIPGLYIRCAKGSKPDRQCFASSDRSDKTRPCRYKTFIDGAPVTDLNLSQLSVADYAGIESYRGGSGIPPQYNMIGSTCGVLLFWTREH